MGTLIWRFLSYRDPDFLNAMEGAPPDEPATAAYLRRAGRAMAEQGFLFAIVEKASGRTIGEVCLQWMNQDRGKIPGEKVMRLPIGIWDKSLWGRGYGKEVARRLMAYAFEEVGIDRLCRWMWLPTMRDQWHCGGPSVDRRKGSGPGESA